MNKEFIVTGKWVGTVSSRPPRMLGRIRIRIASPKKPRSKASGKDGSMKAH